MNLLYGEIVDFLEEEGIRFGRLRVGGALKKIPLDLLTDAALGDTVLVCDGVAISRVDPQNSNVPRDSR